MRNLQLVFALVALLAVPSVCGSPAIEQPTLAPTIPVEPAELTATPRGDNVGTINLVNSQVQTGPPDHLQYLEGVKDFYDGDNVRVTEGGKGKLTLNDGSLITLFNETEVSGVHVSTSPLETDLFLQNQGFLGHVPPGTPMTVNMPNGAKITIMGTYFFVLFNAETQVATAGNFDGLVSYTPPGGTEQDLALSTMVNIPAQGEVELMELPFTPEQFEAAVDSAGTPTAGLSALIKEYQIEPVAAEPTAPSSGPELVRFKPGTWVDSVTFSSDGRFVLSVTHDNIPHVSDAFSGEEVARLAQVEGQVHHPVFSADGQYVVSADWEPTIRVLEMATGREVSHIDHNDYVTTYDLSSDGRYVVSGSYDGMVIVWEADTGNQVARIPHDRDVEFVAFSPDSRYALSVVCDEVDISGYPCTKYGIRVLEIPTGEEVAHIAHDKSVSNVAFSADNRYVVASDDSSIILWDVSLAQEVVRMDHRFVVDLVFSPDGKYLTAGNDEDARVWEIPTGGEVARTPHDDQIASVAFSPDSKYVVSGSWDHSVRVWEASSGNEVARMFHDDRVVTVDFSPDGRYVVSGSQNGTVLVWLWQPG